jgi:UDP-N-acetylglucosamine 3-dehydrogenase
MTSTHKDIALAAMKARTNVLVEKPIAMNLKEARLMIETAKKYKMVFTVGHVERFNPVITKIKEFLDKELIKNIYIINTHRVGPFPKRLLGKIENVLIDLSVHDFDIIAYLGGKIKSTKSQIIRSNNQEIYARVLMDLSSNIKASSEFSWVSPRHVRSIEIYGDSGMIFGDYFNQEVWFYENGDFSHSPLTSSFLGTGLITPGRVIKYPMYKQEPLLLELRNFIKAIQHKEKILVQPAQAYEALRVALEVKSDHKL